jgi:CDP-diacylglycerol--glycerol-3-phosphate 3-phosphatidyltransferase
MPDIRERLHDLADPLLAPLARLLARLGVSANHITIAGTLIGIGAAWLIVEQQLLIAGLVFLFASAFDALDGVIARTQGQATPFGAFLDSTLDRISEGFVMAAIALHFAMLGQPWNAGAVVLALLGSLLVSYTRARAEALGATCTVGFGTRLERVIILGFGLIAGLVAPAIYLLVILTGWTTLQRILHTRQQLAADHRRPTG